MGPTFSVCVPDMAIGTNATDTLANIKSLLEIPAATNQSLRISAVDITFDGVTSGNKPVLFQLTNASASGTFPSSSLAPCPCNNDTAAQATVVTAANVKWGLATGEGTINTAYVNGHRIYRLNPTGGTIYQLPLGRELWVPKGTFFRVRAVGVNAVNATINVEWEE